MPDFPWSVQGFIFCHFFSLRIPMMKLMQKLKTVKISLVVAWWQKFLVKLKSSYSKLGFLSFFHNPNEKLQFSEVTCPSRNTPHDKKTHKIIKYIVLKWNGYGSQIESQKSSKKNMETHYKRESFSSFLFYDCNGG